MPLRSVPKDGMSDTTLNELMEAGRRARQGGERAAAAAAFRAAVELRPGHVWARLELAVELAHLARLDEAEALLRGVLSEAPGTAAAHLRLADVHRRRGHVAAALAACEAAVAADPGHVGARLELAQELIRESRLEEAERLCRAVLAEAPTTLVAHLRLGEVLRRRGDVSGAVVQYRAAVSTDPRHPGARLELALALAQLGQVAAAEQHLRDLLAQAPHHVAAWLRLADLARRRSDRDATLSLLRQAVAAEPVHLQARLALAHELADQGLAAAALPILDAILAADPTEVLAWLRLGQVRRLAGDRAAALEAFRQAATLRPGAAQPLVEMAVEERALGRPDQSEATLRHALAVEPGHLQATMQLAEHAMLAERPEEALTLATEVQAADPTSLPARLVVARATALLQGHDTAVLLLEQAAATLGDHPELLVLRVELLRQTGRTDRMRPLLTASADRLRSHVPLWLQAVQLDIALGEHAAARFALADPPPGSAREQAGIQMARARLAEAEGDLAGAVAACEAGLCLHPESPGPHHELARLQLRRLDLDAAAMHLRAWVRLGASAKLLRGETLNPSQTQTGQILDEFRLDGPVLAALLALRDQPAAARIGPLLELVRDNPDHTPSAISLLFALREAGLLEPGPAPAARPIPRIIPLRIAQYWSDPDPPPDLLPLMRSWQDHHPDHAWRLYDDAAAAGFLAERLPAGILDAYRRASLPAQKADIFRLAWLFLEGGIYADVDDRCHAPLPGLLPAGVGFAGYLEEFGTIGNNLLAAAPGHPVIGRALTLAAQSVNRGDADVVWLATGPGLLTRAFAQILGEAEGPPEVMLRACVLLNRSRVARAVAMHCAVDYKQGRQHWLRSVFARQGPRMVVRPAPVPAPG